LEKQERDKKKERRREREVGPEVPTV